jgi:hypothetical protein
VWLGSVYAGYSQDAKPEDGIVVDCSSLAFASILLRGAWFNIPFHSFHTISIPFNSALAKVYTGNRNSAHTPSLHFQAMIVQIPRRKEDAKK